MAKVNLIKFVYFILFYLFIFGVEFFFVASDSQWSSCLSFHSARNTGMSYIEPRVSNSRFPSRLAMTKHTVLDGSLI